MFVQSLLRCFVAVVVDADVVCSINICLCSCSFSSPSSFVCIYAAGCFLLSVDYILLQTIKKKVGLDPSSQSAAMRPLPLSPPLPSFVPPFTRFVVWFRALCVGTNVVWRNQICCCSLCVSAALPTELLYCCPGVFLILCSAFVDHFPSIPHSSTNNNNNNNNKTTRRMA